jgi:hypothetical protein
LSPDILRKKGKRVKMEIAVRVGGNREEIWVGGIVRYYAKLK